MTKTTNYYVYFLSWCENKQNTSESGRWFHLMIKQWGWINSKECKCIDSQTQEKFYCKKSKILEIYSRWMMWNMKRKIETIFNYVLVILHWSAEQNKKLGSEFHL